MNNGYNVMFVSNSINYVEEFKRISKFYPTIDLSAVVRGVHDFKVRYQPNNVHIVLISDELSNGNLQELLDFLVDYEVLVFGIIKHKESEFLLENYGVSYIYEDEKTPAELIEFLSESLSTLPLEEGQEQSAPKEEQVEHFESRFDENNMNNREMDNQYRYSYDNERNDTHSFEENPNQFRQQPMVSQQRVNQTTMGVLKPKVVCLSSAKGGVGKSALALELASCIAARGKEVEVNMSTMRGANNDVSAVLVDLNDAFGTIAATLPFVSDMKNPPSLADWIIKIRDKIYKGLSFEDKKELQSQKNPHFAPYIYKMNRNMLGFTKEEVLRLLVKDPKSGLYVLPTLTSNLDVDKVEDEFIEIVIEELHKFFDVVLLDTGNNFEAFTQTAFRMSDEIYLVGQPNYQVTVILKNLLKDAIEGIGIDKSKFRLIINHPQTNKQRVDDEAVQRNLDIPLAGAISHDENMLLAHDEGKFYVINNKKKQVSRDILLIANQICPLWNVSNPQKKGGFLKRFFTS